MDINSKKPVIEIVDDEVAERIVLRDKLIHNGLAVLEAKDGVEGLEIALREHPDLILLDIRMPNMDGMTMMKKLRTDEWGNKEPIIFLTNYNAADVNLLEVINGQPAYYLMKVDTPIDEVVKKIREVLKSKENDLSEEVK